MNFTVLGATGFIGRHLTAHLHAQGHAVNIPPRDAHSLDGQKLGHVIYAIGLTGNFRRMPRETVDAHVATLQRLMAGADFESWLYLSSTRIYGGLPAGAATHEEASIPVTPSPDSLYDLSKMLGEAICLGANAPYVRVARLSNVYGAQQSRESFLGSVLEDVRRTGKVQFGESSASAKDYISIHDVCRYLEAIALSGQHKTYNVASGESVTHGHIAQSLQQAGYSANFAPNGATRIFPPIDTARLNAEFGAPRHKLLEDLPQLATANHKELKP